MPAVPSAYHAALQKALGSYANPLVPKQVTYPDDRYELNVRPGATAAEMGWSLDGLMRHMCSGNRFDVGIKKGKHRPVMIPKYGKIHCDIAAGTRASVDIQVSGGPPHGNITFNPPIWISDPLQFGGTHWANNFYGFSFEGVEFCPDKSIWVHGHILKLFGFIKIPFDYAIVAAPDSHAGGVDMVVRMTASLITHWVGTVVRSLGMVDKPDEELIHLWKSIFPLLDLGTMTCEGAIRTDKTLVVRTEAGDAVFDPQTLWYGFKATVVPHDSGVELHIDKGKIQCKAITAKVSGTLSTDGAGFDGRDLDLQVQNLQFEFDVTDGEPNAVLVPLQIDSRSAHTVHDVARLQGNFVARGGFSIDGEVHINVPTEIHDENRDIRIAQINQDGETAGSAALGAEQAHLTIEHADVQAILCAHARIGAPPPPQYVASITDADAGAAAGSPAELKVVPYRAPWQRIDMQGSQHELSLQDEKFSVGLHVHGLRVEGVVNGEPVGLGGMHVAARQARLSIDAHNRENSPFKLDARYVNRTDPTPAASMSAKITFEIPLTLRNARCVHIEHQPGTYTDVHRLGLLLRGVGVLPTQRPTTTLPSNGAGSVDMHADTTLIMHDIDADLHTDYLDLTNFVITKPTTLHLHAPAGATIEAALECDPNNPAIALAGGGSFLFTATTASPGTTHLQGPGGPLRIWDGNAEISCEQLEFARTAGSWRYTAPLQVDYETRARGRFCGTLTPGADGLQFTAQTMAKEDDNTPFVYIEPD